MVGNFTPEHGKGLTRQGVTVQIDKSLDLKLQFPFSSLGFANFP